MAIYERMSGRHVAERVRVPDGSDEAKRFAESPKWRAVEAPKPPTVDPMERPPQSATKDQWVAHAVAAHGLDEAEAAKSTKAELIEITAEPEDEQ